MDLGEDQSIASHPTGILPRQLGQACPE